MKQFRNNVIRAGLEALYFTGAHYLMRPLFAGVGAIFMLHHVRPRRDAEFQPNHHLEIAPGFLHTMLRHLRNALKPDGRLVLLESRKEDPSIPIREDHKMSVAEAKLELEAEGFSLSQVVESLPRQHILIFTKR